ncbi:MAG: methyltransferase domain-containing protein [Lentisphaerae bacterium]|nr:methyltransferase domain-containing protein [Lentisphaerota bacterium]
MPPKLNFTYYSGTDAYTDGAIEDELLDIVKSGSDYHKILKKDSRWPILYHLSPERRNLLEWFLFKKTGSLLEIGAGCGALTQLFTERVASVTSVELSKKRAEIIAARNRLAENLEIVVGNFCDMQFEVKFDYATLIGVLEYANVFMNSQSPCDNLLLKTRESLKSGGTLIVAIENKFGIKYFAGAPDDHTRRVFEGIEGYPIRNGPETFSKDELSDLLIKNGFSDIEFYYPHPDYKLPREVFNDRMLPGTNHNLLESDNFTGPRVRLFDERRALLNIARSGKFDYFANSFLVFATCP